MLYVMNCIPVLLIVALTTISHSIAAEIHFEIYSRNDSTRVLIAKGQRTYADSDFVVNRELREGQFYGVKKVLELSNGFGVGVLDTLENSDGFGLSVEHLPIGSNPNDFSWEWYDRGKSGLFTKRQGGTKIEVEFSGFPATTQIRHVRFLDDAEFEYIQDICCKPSDGGPTHVLVIKRGSVLDFPPK